MPAATITKEILLAALGHLLIDQEALRQFVQGDEDTVIHLGDPAEPTDSLRRAMHKVKGALGRLAAEAQEASFQAGQHAEAAQNAVAENQAILEEMDLLVQEAKGITSTLFLESGVYNVRAAMRVNELVPAGSVLTLPAQYYPRRNVLFLSYGGVICTPYGVGVAGASGYQYREIGKNPNVPSDKVKIYFDAEPGMIFDVWVVTSALGKNLDQLTALAAAGAAAANRSESEADRAGGEADRAYNEVERLLAGFDASMITSGIIDLAHIPAAALEHLVIVTDDAARFALTVEQVQKGDTVKVDDSGLMYLVVDDTRLDEPTGYVEYVAGRAAAVDWGGVENKPPSFTPSGHVASHKQGGADALTPADIGLDVTTARQVTTVEDALEAGADFTVPAYTVGDNKLSIWFNGVRCHPGADTAVHQYIEVGTAGAASITIQFNFELAADDVVMAEVR